MCVYALDVVIPIHFQEYMQCIRVVALYNVFNMYQLLWADILIPTQLGEYTCYRAISLLYIHCTTTPHELVYMYIVIHLCSLCSWFWYCGTTHSNASKEKIIHRNTILVSIWQKYNYTCIIYNVYMYMYNGAHSFICCMFYWSWVCFVKCISLTNLFLSLYTLFHSSESVH